MSKYTAEQYKWARDFVSNSREFTLQGYPTALQDAADILLAVCKDYENGITWMTTCHNCANLMDKLAGKQHELDMAREMADNDLRSEYQDKYDDAVAALRAAALKENP